MDLPGYDYVTALVGEKSTGKTTYLNILNGTYPRRLSPLKRNSSQIITFQTAKGNTIRVKFDPKISDNTDLIVIFCAQNDHSSIRAVNDKWIPEAFCKNIPILIACTKFDMLPINSDNFANYEMLIKLADISNFKLGSKIFMGFPELTNGILKKLTGDPDVEFEDIYV